jgi:hypothetical protein
MIIFKGVKEKLFMTLVKTLRKTLLRTLSTGTGLSQGEALQREEVAITAKQQWGTGWKITKRRHQGWGILAKLTCQDSCLRQSW